MSNPKFDAIDRKILAALQRDGRLSNVELAQAVGLSPSPCLRRVRLLEEAGVIEGYHARLNRGGLGLVTVFVDIKVERHDKGSTEFREAVQAIAEVVSCHLVSGQADFLLQVVVADLPAYERLLMGDLLKLPGVTDLRSNFAIQTLKGESPLPLDHLP